MKIICKAYDCSPVVVTMGRSRTRYWSKRIAVNKIAWRLLYDSDRIHDDISKAFNMPRRGYGAKRLPCECETLAYNPVTGMYKSLSRPNPELCRLHNRYDGYYVRLHAKIVRWIRAGYILPESGLRDDTTA